MVLENIIGCLVENTHLLFEKVLLRVSKKATRSEGRHPNTAQWTHIVEEIWGLRPDSEQPE